MGNCNSEPAVIDKKAVHQYPSKTTGGKTNQRIKQNAASSQTSTSAFFKSIFSVAEPIVRRVVSQILIDEHGVLKDEARIPAYKHDQPDDTLPIHPLELDFKDLRIIDQQTLALEEEQYPSFEWPTRDVDADDDGALKDGNPSDMLVLDLIDLSYKMRFQEGIEIIVPFEGPLGIAGNLEVGSGKSMKDAWLQLKVPKLRIWYSKTRMVLYIAFWDRPDMIPHLHVNADFGGGDRTNMNFTEKGSLDDVVEKILSGFSPKDLSKKKNDEIQTGSSDSSNTKREKESFMGNRIGAALIKALSRFQNVGNGRPFELDLKDSIQPSIDNLLKKPRTQEAIKADIKALEMELKEVQDDDDVLLNRVVYDDHKKESSSLCGICSDASTASITTAPAKTNIHENIAPKEVQTGRFCCW